MSDDKKNIIYSDDHHFNTLIAKEFGVDVAIFIKNLYFLSRYVMSNDKNFYDDYYWIYNKLSAFQDYLPYYTEKQIRRIINKSLNDGLILIGNYNKHKYDKTNWYCLTEKALSYHPDLEQKLHIKRQSSLSKGQIKPSLNCETIITLQTTPSLICPNGQMDSTKWANANSHLGNSICPNGQTYTSKIENKIISNNNNNASCLNPEQISKSNPEPVVVVFSFSIDKDLVSYKNSLPPDLHPLVTSDHEFLEWAKFKIDCDIQSQDISHGHAINKLKKLMRGQRLEKPEGFFSESEREKAKAECNARLKLQEEESRRKGDEVIRAFNAQPKKPIDLVRQKSIPRLGDAIKRLTFG